MLPGKSQSEKFVEQIYALSILMLLLMAGIAFYITNISITYVYGNFASLIVLLYRSSFFVIFLFALVIGYVQRKKPHSNVRRRVLVMFMLIVMLVFVIFAWFTYIVWDPDFTQRIEIAIFAVLSLIEIFILAIHTMAFSVPRSGNSG